MTDTMTDWLHHPEHQELPAMVLIDCVFALAPNGRILHFHKEQMEIEKQGDEQHFTLTESAPSPDRSHCQIIPPFVTAFPSRS
jgi:hypothetical protein